MYVPGRASGGSTRYDGPLILGWLADGVMQITCLFDMDIPRADNFNECYIYEGTSDGLPDGTPPLHLWSGGRPLTIDG
jgi:hypothetical protein